MAFTHVITRGYRDSTGATISSIETITDDTTRDYTGQAPATTNNHPVVWGVTAANLKSLSISTDQAITIYTNAPSTGSPQDTIALVAGQNLIWDLAFDGSGKIPFSGNVTELYISNAGSTVANVNIRSLSHQGN